MRWSVISGPQCASPLVIKSDLFTNHLRRSHDTWTAPYLVFKIQTSDLKSCQACGLIHYSRISLTQAKQIIFEVIIYKERKAVKINIFLVWWYKQDYEFLTYNFLHQKFFFTNWLMSRKYTRKILESCATPNWLKGSVGQKESRSQIPSPRSSIPNPKLKFLNPNCRFLNPKSWIPNPESQILNSKSWIPNPESQILNPKSWIPNP